MVCLVLLVEMVLLVFREKWAPLVKQASLGKAVLLDNKEDRERGGYQVNVGRKDHKVDQEIQAFRGDLALEVKLEKVVNKEYEDQWANQVNNMKTQIFIYVVCNLWNTNVVTVKPLI